MGFDEVKSLPTFKSKILKLKYVIDTKRKAISKSSEGSTQNVKIYQNKKAENETL